MLKNNKSIYNANRIIMIYNLSVKNRLHVKLMLKIWHYEPLFILEILQYTYYHIQHLLHITEYQTLNYKLNKTGQKAFSKICINDMR